MDYIALQCCTMGYIGEGLEYVARTDPRTLLHYSEPWAGRHSFKKGGGHWK